MNTKNTPRDPDPVPVPATDEELLSQCRLETFRSGGPGGQHQNTTDSGVRLIHLPTGIRVTARRERSQHRNRKAALATLRTRLEKLHEVEAPRIPTRVPSREKKRRLEAKKRRAETKRARRPPGTDET
ncbi:MAG: peptide chain release factor-like protein [Gemmatimonadota bacterium]|nr:peptide chain release factor-like protein [Gemmatimonadota bacterium]